MREELLENLRGSGEVSREHGAAVGNRRYHITIWQELHNSGAISDMRDGADGRKKIMGTIELLNDEAYALIGAPLVLTLDDGRRLPFFFRSTEGAITARGALTQCPVTVDRGNSAVGND